MKNLIKKSSLMVVSVLLIFSFLSGAEKKKKKNINKYIFAGGNRLVVFDGENKTVQRAEIGFIPASNKPLILYFAKEKKIILTLNNSMDLYSVNINNLKDFYKVDLSQFNRHGKKYNMGSSRAKYKDGKHALISYEEWDISWTNGLVDNGVIPDKYGRIIKWDISKNTFSPISYWDKLEDDPYEARTGGLVRINDKKIKGWKEWLQENEHKKTGTKKQKKSFKRMKRMYKYNKKFLKLLKKGKINVGSYNKISDLQVRPTGGRYMVVRNDKLYLVHMKTKEVYTLWDDPFEDLRYFIIEKNEDDVDLDKE